jgi:hypothetical protein
VNIRAAERVQRVLLHPGPQKPLRSLMRAIPGAHPAGALRASNFVPDKIVRLCGEISFIGF